MTQANKQRLVNAARTILATATGETRPETLVWAETIIREFDGQEE